MNELLRCLEAGLSVHFQPDHEIPGTIRVCVTKQVGDRNWRQWLRMDDAFMHRMGAELGIGFMLDRAREEIARHFDLQGSLGRQKGDGR